MRTSNRKDVVTLSKPRVKPLVALRNNLMIIGGGINTDEDIFIPTIEVVDL